MLLISSMKSVCFSKCQTLNLKVSVFCWALLHFANITKPWKKNAASWLAYCDCADSEEKREAALFAFLNSFQRHLTRDWTLRNHEISVSSSTASQQVFLNILLFVHCLALSPPKNNLCAYWKKTVLALHPHRNNVLVGNRVKNSWNDTLSLTCGQNKCNLLKTMMS